MTKLITMVAIAGSALTFAPEPVEASECAAQYTKCLNDSWMLKGAMQLLADVDCFSEYAGCVRRNLLGL